MEIIDVLEKIKYLLSKKKQVIITSDNYYAYKLLCHLKPLAFKKKINKDTFKKMFPDINVNIPLEILIKELEEYEQGGSKNNNLDKNKKLTKIF